MTIQEATEILQAIRNRLESYIAVDPDAMPNLTARWKADRDAMGVVLAEIERLREFVASLPTTADGVTMFPGMEIWCNGLIRYDNGAVMKVKAAKHSVGWTFDGWGELVGEYYSTKNAATAAGGGA